MQLPQDISDAIEAITEPEGKRLAAYGILAFTWMKLLTNLETAKDSLDKLVLGLTALKDHDINISAIEKTSSYVNAAILELMELAEERKLND